MLTILNDCVLIEPDPVRPYHEQKGYHHIIVPEQFEHGPEDRVVWGRVTARGRGCRLSDIRLGSHVVIGKWAGASVTYHHTRYLLVREYDILAVEQAKARHG